MGGPWVAISRGDAQMWGVADDDFDEIGSVSVRSARSFTLLACTRVHSQGGGFTPASRRPRPQAP